MSTKLSVCAYVAIVDFTLFYLSILAMIMTFNFKVINIQKNFDETCNFSLINLTINDQTSTSYDSSTIQTISSDTLPLITQLINQEVTNIILSGQVGSPCTSYEDCLGGVIVGINGTYQTMACQNSVCVCNDPYSRVVYKPNYQCAIPNGNVLCVEDIQCEGTCSLTGNQYKCTG